MDFLSSYFKYENGLTVTGLTKELNVFYVLELFKKENKNIVILANTLFEANMYFDSLKTYTDDVCLFPMDDFLTSVAVAVSPDLKIKRLETLERIRSSKKTIVVTNLMGFLRYLPNKNDSSNLEFNLKKGIDVKRDQILEILDKYGYVRESMVTTTGEYAVRGYIIDVFIIDEERPIRIEFFGDEVDSIRYFDESSQLSIKEIDSIKIKPYTEVVSDSNSSLVDYMDDPYVVMVNKDQIDIAYEKLLNDITEYNEAENISRKHMYELEDISYSNVIYLNNIGDSSVLSKAINFKSQEIENFNSDFELLSKYCDKEIAGGKTVVICLSNEKQLRSLEPFLSSYHIVDKGKLIDREINILYKKINSGFVFDKYVVIAESDIEKIKNAVINYKNSYHIGKKIKDFGQLSVGDYIVHSQHGIGIYNGVITLTKNGLKKDYIQLNYQGNDKIYIPVEKISTIFKYAGKEGSMPKLDKLNSTSWAKKKRELRSKIKDISGELIKLYAARSSVKGTPFKDYAEEAVFGSEFVYKETLDQLKAIEDIDNDLSSEIPMDRLLCGDVGFGKTEVAFRAMFKAIVNNKQVFYLCPTTILSKQQYENALERFKNYPIEIALLNRFTSAKETKRILDGLEKGTIDLVFGTHRLLSGDVKFAKLGLLIVDEEQRFGVTHKEKIKEYKNDVNVLTLSATPIPRTLKMALSGLRDLSIIDTPPTNRYPVQTYVIQENDLIIKDAIYKELSRNGQIFILYNKVASIESKMQQIHKLVPEARITFAHGQMSKKELEDVMESFINYEYDILLCTTIIETGIDISNANTLIIYDADCFGLSQLYQLRGRVGRSNRIAYAYLMYDKQKMLNDVAVKRLQAIKEFTELGSGYRIAMRDLSIRGAGDLLGSEQAGFVDTVGIELYMQMIEEEMRRMKGELVEEDEDENISTKSLVEVETHISDDYVSDEDIKIEIHKKINEIDGYNKLQEIRSELEDRFGKISKSMEIYMYEEWFEKQAKELGVTTVRQSDREIEIELPKEISSKIEGDKFFITAYQVNPRFRLKYLHEQVIIALTLLNQKEHFLYYVVPLMEEVKKEIKEK
ncbi:MAG: transcription-repair coupling factor [Bacilli bacterium]|nr:transcription-repair coupling factor [Bacilli bacterium]